MGLDRLHFLIHELFQHGPEQFSFLENFIINFGGRILGDLTQEIDTELNIDRKKAPTQFYLKVSERYQVDNGSNYRVLL